MGDKGYEVLAELITANTTLDTVVFDNCGCDTWEALERVVVSGESRRSPMHLMYPGTTFEGLVSQRRIDALDEVRLRFIRVQTGNAAESPFEVMSQGTEATDFPRYFTADLHRMCTGPIKGLSCSVDAAIPLTKPGIPAASRATGPTQVERSGRAESQEELFLSSSDGGSHPVVKVDLHWSDSSEERLRQCRTAQFMDSPSEEDPRKSSSISVQTPLPSYRRNSGRDANTTGS
jgi:hypothetical protein